MLGFTSNASGAIAIAYISDSYKDLTAEGMITMTLLRNTLGFAAGYYIVRAKSLYHAAHHLLCRADICVADSVARYIWHSEYIHWHGNDWLWFVPNLLPLHLVWQVGASPYQSQVSQGGCKDDYEALECGAYFESLLHFLSRSIC